MANGDKSLNEVNYYTQWVNIQKAEAEEADRTAKKLAELDSKRHALEWQHQKSISAFRLKNQIKLAEEEEKKALAAETNEKKREKLEKEWAVKIAKLKDKFEKELGDRRLKLESEIKDAEKGINDIRMKSLTIGTDAELTLIRKRENAESRLYDSKLKNLTNISERLIDLNTEQQLAQDELMRDREALGITVLRNYQTEENNLKREALMNYLDLYEDQISAQMSAQFKKISEQEKALQEEIKQAEERALEEKRDGLTEVEQEEFEKRKKALENEKENIAKKYAFDDKTAKKFEKLAAKRKKAKDDKETKEKNKKAGATLLDKDASWADKKEALYSLTHTIDEETGEEKFSAKKSMVALTDTMVSALGDFAKKLDKKIDDIAVTKGEIDTRLQGSKNEKSDSSITAPSYWERMSKDIVGIAGVSPFVKQEKIVENVKSLVGKGISYNVTQRAFLETIKDKIATTFNATDGTLLRLVRIQQKDSTAARLGMESALNTFLNNMYETTEFMSDVMTSIKGSLEEAMSLMTAEQSVAFEYQVQKWMGSLYSVGMSQSAVQNIATSLGKLAAGDIEGVIGSEVGNLMVMSANEANLSLANMLAKGLDESSTNKLLSSMVSYLGNLYNQSKDNLVVQQQIARVYGMSASDLRAASSMAKSNDKMIQTIGNAFNYSESLDQLWNMTNTILDRTSLGEILTNSLDNFQYTLAAGMANNPVLYGINKLGGALESLVGGIALPGVLGLGTGVIPNTTVADLMRVSAMSGGLIDSMIQIFSSEGDGGFNIRKSIESLGVEKYGRGKASQRSRMGSSIEDYINYANKAKDDLKLNEANISSSGLIDARTLNAKANRRPSAPTVSNISSGDVKNKTMTDFNNESSVQVAEAKENEGIEEISKSTNSLVANIYNLLGEALNGEKILTVKLDNSVTNEVKLTDDTLDRIAREIGV